MYVLPFALGKYNCLGPAGIVIAIPLVVGITTVTTGQHRIHGKSYLHLYQ